MSQERPVTPQPEQPQGDQDSRRTAFNRLLANLGVGCNKGVNDAFQDLLKASEERVANATGATPEDFKYGQAESVREADIPGYVYVTMNGREYGPARMTWGPLDGDKEKSTALVNTKDEDPNARDNWIKLWFKDSDVQKSSKK